MKLKHFSIVFSVAGILVLYLFSKISEPTLISIDKIPSYEGKQVVVIGTIIKFYSTEFGSQIITLEENNVSTTVFIDSESNVEYGDKIQVTGEVQK